MTDESRASRTTEGDRPESGAYRFPDLGEAARMVGRRWWIALLVAVLGSAGAAAGARAFRPLYQSYALIRLRAPAWAKVGAAAVEQEEEAEIPEPAEMVRRLTVATTSRAALDALEVKLVDDISPEDRGRASQLVDSLADQIEVEHRQGNLYRIYVKAHTPDLARQTARHLSEWALAAHRSGYEVQAVRLEEFAKKQVDDLSAKIKRLEDQMVAFLEANPMMRVKSLHSDQILGVEGVDRLRARGTGSVVERSIGKLAEQDPELKELLARRRRLTSELKGLGESGTTGATTAYSQALAEAKSALAELRGQGKTESHPEVKQVLRRVRQIEEKIASTTPGKQTAGSDYEAKVRKELVQLQQKIRAIVGRAASRLPQPKEDRAALEAEWARMRRQHQRLSEEHSRLQEVAVNATLKRNLRSYEASKTAVLVEHPRAPEAPIGLSRRLILVAGGVASLLLGIALAIGLGILDTRLYRPEQVNRAHEDLQVLAVLSDLPIGQMEQPPRIRHQELLEGETGSRGEPSEATGPPRDAGDDGSVIKWLRATDDLDSALSLLKQGQEQDWLQQAEEKWLDAAATQFYERRGPRALGSTAASEGKVAPREELVSSAGRLHHGPHPVKVSTLPSAAPLAPGLFVSTHPKSRAAEQMRLLAARIESEIGTSLRVVAVTSWEQGVGKTTVAANLAMVLAESQKRVLVIDACPGDAALTRLFGIEPDGRGLCEQLQSWLDGGSSPWEVVQIAETLTVLCASSIEQPALPLLSSEGFGQLVDDMSQTYDALVVDTVALSRASDAVVLQRRVDGYVVVAGKKRSTMQSLGEASGRIDPGRILGVVFNEHV